MTAFSIICFLSLRTLESFPSDYYPDIFLKSARNICRAPPPQKSGRWKCTNEDNPDSFTAGVSCELKCNDGYRPIGSKLNVGFSLVKKLKKILELQKIRKKGEDRKMRKNEKKNLKNV